MTQRSVQSRPTDVQRLDVQFAMQTASTGKDSLALASWLTDSGEVASDPLAIRTEVVVWLDHDLYYFQAAERRRSGTLQLLPFLEHLRQAGRVQGEHFVASVEFGNELMGGTGTTWVEEYAVLLAAARAVP